MRFHYGHRDQDFEDLANHMAESQPDDHYPMSSQKRTAATLLEAAARLDQMGRRRLYIDMLDIATKMIAGDSYAWPRTGGRDT